MMIIMSKRGWGTYLPGRDYAAMYASDKSITVRVVGVVRQKQDVRIGTLGSGIAYSDELSQIVIDNAINSKIVQAQRLSDKTS